MTEARWSALLTTPEPSEDEDRRTIVSRTDREHQDNWYDRDYKRDRKRWQRRYRQATRLAIAHDDWDGAERRWRRTSGWLTH